MNQKSKKTAKRKGDEEMIFEVYRILTPASLGNFEAFDGFNDSEPFATTEKKLSEVCAQKFGGGQYVAFQLSESGEGDPLSYWVVKVRDREHHNSMRVYPREDLINIVREERKPSSLDDVFYPRNLAMIASLCLRDLEEPKAKESKESPQVKRAKALIKHYGANSKSKVIARLKAEAKKLWLEEFERGIENDPKWLDQVTKSAYEAAKRSLRGRGEQRKAIKTGRKTRRT